MSDKIKPHHLERKAILYICQSSAYQVSHNLESQKLQYAMQDVCSSWAGARSKLWMKIWVGRQPGRSRVRASSVWWRKCV